MSKFLDSLKKRRSIYGLGRNTDLSNEEIETIIKDAVKNSPSAFNSQTSRVVFLFGEANQKLWEITEETLKPLTPAEFFPNTQAKLAGFAAGIGTALFFEDTDVVANLQEQFPLYADNFPDWSEQSTGIAAVNAWVALAEANIGANLQHYNPVIDEKVAAEFDIPDSWNLRGQLVFGSIEAPAGEKDFMNDADRFKSFN
ncbi:MAG: nitroreductase family protein [Lactobacillales bacterium]|nr:nitroreductase family protein [Lactobacillales bacterium]